MDTEITLERLKLLRTTQRMAADTACDYARSAVIERSHGETGRLSSETSERHAERAKNLLDEMAWISKHAS